MEVTVNSKLGISANEQVILEMFRRGKDEMAFRYIDKVQPDKLHNHLLDYLTNLEKKGYIVVDKATQKVTLTKAGKGKQTEDCSEWIDAEYRSMFPPKKKGDRQTCIKHMNEFLYLYDYGKEVIIEATRTYLEEQEFIKYISEADNFIKKSGRSKLNMYCEELGTVDSNKHIEDRA